jgi:hypothetical protein
MKKTSITNFLFLKVGGEALGQQRITQQTFKKLKVVPNSLGRNRIYDLSHEEDNEY